MDRKIPGSPLRKYDHAAPIRVEKLRFPATGPSALKKKGVLGKSGNYFSKEAKEELCLLLKVVTNTTGTNRYVPLVAEEKVIWTWDEDVYSSLEKYLKTEPVGMCRHTAAMVSKKDREIKNSHKGVCTRTECIDTLGVTDLLMTFLKKPLSAKARNERYNFILRNFPPTKEIVLFDSGLPEFANRRLVLDGIKKKTMRHVLHSNGKHLWVFDIVYYGNSKLEEMKNMLRPLALNGKRKGTDRGFVLKFVACDSKDTLTEWWNDILYHTNGLSSADYHAENIEECDLNGMLKGLAPTGEDDTFGQRFAQETHSMTVGEGTEAFKKEFRTSLSMEDLMSLLIQTQNVTDPSKCLDSFIVSTSSTGAEKLQVLVDPLNKSDKVLDKYGNNTQRMLLQAVTKETLDTNVSFVPEFISNLSMFSFLKDMSFTTNSESLARYFDLQKSYVFNGEKEFSVSYLPTSESDYIGKLSSSGASSSTLDQVILTVTQAELRAGDNSIHLDQEIMTCINFNHVWEERRREAVDAFRQLAPREMFPAGLANVRQFEEKQLVCHLFQGYRENAVIGLLELVQKTADRYLANDLTFVDDAVSLSFLLQGVEAIVLHAQTAFAIESAFSILKQLVLDAIVQTQQNNLVKNTVCATYLRLFKIVQRKHKFTLLPDFIIKDTLSFMKQSFAANRQIPSCVLELCKSFVEVGKAHKSSIYTLQAASVKSQIDHFVDQLSAVEILLLAVEQDRALRQIQTLQERGEAKTVCVPYILQHDFQLGNLVIRSTPFNTATDNCFRLQKGKVTIKASGDGLRNETARVLALLKANNTGTDSGNETLEKSSSGRNFVARDVTDFLQQIRRELGVNHSIQKLFSILEHAGTSLSLLPAPVRSEVTVCAKADRARLFGKKVENSQLGLNWGSDLLNNVAVGLRKFENAV